MAKITKSHPVLSNEALELVASRFRMLGDQSRLRILNQLMQSESSVQQLVTTTGLTQPNVSRHLGMMRTEGIVSRRSEGNHKFYCISDPTIAELCNIVCSNLSSHLLSQIQSLPDLRPA
jgi:ArsR family transcriptional regulator